MNRAAVRSKTRRAPARPVVLGIVRQDGSWVVARPKSRRPAWWLLYGIGLLTVGGLWAAEVVLPESPVRTSLELLAVLAGIALIRFWVGCNRWRLAHPERQGDPAIQIQGEDGSSVREAE